MEVSDIMGNNRQVVDERSRGNQHIGCAWRLADFRQLSRDFAANLRYGSIELESLKVGHHIRINDMISGGRITPVHPASKLGDTYNRNVKSPAIPQKTTRDVVPTTEVSGASVGVE